MTNVNSNNPPSYPAIPEPLRAGVDRLRHITGFVTTLHRPEDPRPRFFSRYYHVRRVALLCQEVGRQHEAAGRRVDREYVDFLAWSHDLYRWPFAHNIEPRGFPFSSETAARQITELALSRSGRPEAGTDICGIITRRRDSLSPEAEICLLSDMMAGFFEDCLMVVAGLNLHPSQLPADDLRLLGITVDDRFLDRAIRIFGLLAGAKAVDGAVVEFDAWFLELATAFIRGNRLGRPGALQSQEFERTRARIKEHLLCLYIYPLNNEHVSKGSRIRQLLQPILPQFVNSQALLDHDECSLVDFLVREGLLPLDAMQELMPDLDYVREQRPEHRLV